MLRRSRLLISLALVLLARPAARGAEPTFVSPAHPPLLLEIYTSEGCSSCPPADLWLGELKGEPNLWTGFIPVTLHVDYWDHLGWKDPLASRRMSVRQRQEAVAGKVYTPGFFLNGVEWKGFFKAEAFPPQDAPDLGKLTVTQVSPLEFVVDFTPKGVEKGPLELNATLLGMDIRVDVKGGENRGKKLSHDFASLGLRTVPMAPSGGRFTSTIILANGTPIEPPRLAAAFWVTRPKSFVPLQSVGGYLDKGLGDVR